jgi:hypothetical protein
MELLLEIYPKSKLRSYRIIAELLNKEFKQNFTEEDVKFYYTVELEKEDIKRIFNCIV